MTLTYRTAGAWGPGTSANLSPSQLDTNFYTMWQAVQAAVGDITAKNIQDITTNGSQMTITMTDGSSQTFTLPKAVLTWRGNWLTTQTYAVNDMLADPNSGSVYLVMYPHVAAASFDPNLQISGENVYRKMIQGVTAPETLTTTRTLLGDFELDLTSARRYYRIQEDGLVIVTVPPDSVVPFELNTQIAFRQVGDLGQITLDPGPGVTLNLPSGFQAMTLADGSVMGLKKVGPDEWDVVGLLAEV